MKNSILFLAIAITVITALVLPAPQVQGQEKFFFPLPPYRLGQPVIPDSTAQKISAVLSANPGSRHWVGTADVETKVFDDLQAGRVASKLDSKNSNQNFAGERGFAGSTQFGGTYDPHGRIVSSKDERGLILQITPPPLPVSPDTLAFASSLDSVLVEVAERVVKRIPLDLANGHSNGLTAQVIEYYNVLDTLRADQREFFYAQPDGRYRLSFFSPNHNGHKPYVTPYAYQGGVTELVRGEPIAPPTPPPAEKEPVDVSALAFGDGDGFAGATALVTLPTGWVLGAGFDARDWAGRSEQGREVFIGHKLPKLPLLGDNLSFIVGFRNEAELRNYWDAWGGFGSLAFTPRLGGIQLFLQGGVRFMHVKNNLVLGGLIFENTDGGVRVSDEVIQKEGKKNEVSPFIRAGFGIHF